MKYRGFKRKFISQYKEKDYEEMLVKLLDNESWESKLFYKWSKSKFGEKEINEIFSNNSERVGLEFLVKFYCEIDCIIYDEDLIVKGIENNTLKSGDLIDCIFFLNKEDVYLNETIVSKVFFKGKVEIRSVRKNIIGENLKIVEDVLKRLNGGFFNDWEFQYKDKLGYEIFERKYDNHIKSFMSVERGNSLYITKKNVGGIILCEYEDNEDNRIKVVKLERWEDGKKGLGKSILTILSRVCKGNDIIIEIVVGNIISGNSNEKISKIKYDINKLEKYYNKSGFKTNRFKSMDEGMLVLDNVEVVEEYIKRMGWDD